MAIEPRVLNKYRDTRAPGAVYIGRPSHWGNPFVIGRDGDRAEVIRKFREWIAQEPERITRARAELRGKDLICFCAPQPCHGDVLLEIANGD